jgi:hypothetical protein
LHQQLQREIVVITVGRAVQTGMAGKVLSLGRCMPEDAIDELLRRQ